MISKKSIFIILAMLLFFSFAIYAQGYDATSGLGELRRWAKRIGIILINMGLTWRLIKVIWDVIEGRQAKDAIIKWVIALVVLNVVFLVLEEMASAKIVTIDAGA